MSRRIVCLLASTLLLSACGGNDAPADPATDDPAMSGALGGQVLTDPDLAGENGANRAASLSPGDGAVPPTDMSPEALAAARAAALKLVGGPGAMKKAPEAREVTGKLPAAFPVYPKGAVQEAAGTDDGACALRVVNFLTPVPVNEVIDFYFTRASAAGYSVQHVRQSGEDQLGGTKGGASYVVYARELPNGGSSVDLVTNGG